MIKITLIRELTGKELIEKFKEKYRSVESLERAFERDSENVKLYMDLGDWKYFIDNPDEKIKETEVIYTDKSKIDTIELELLGVIKTEHPSSVSELAKLANKDLSSVQKKVKNLNESGFIELKKGTKNSKMPIVNYDKIEIGI